MTTENKIAQLVAVNDRLRLLRRAQRDVQRIDRDLMAATREADQAIKAEEAAAANLGYRRKAFAEARETQARMERNPGVNRGGSGNLNRFDKWIFRSRSA